MTTFAVLAIVAALGATAALVSGVASMVSNGEIAHRTSAQWMNWRVVCQAAALAIIVLALATAAATSDRAVVTQTDCVYDYRMMTLNECLAYRAKVVKAKSEEERMALRDNLHKMLAARVKDGG